MERGFWSLIWGAASGFFRVAEKGAMSLFCPSLWACVSQSACRLERNVWIAATAVFLCIAGTALAATTPPVQLPAAPPLPTIGSTVYNVTLTNPLIDGGAVASTGASGSTNAGVINAFISYASAHGGGTVEIPGPMTGTSTFKSNVITMQNSVNLQIDPNAILQANTAGATLITTPSSGTFTNMEISGGGIIDGHATAATSNNLVTLQKVTNLEITNVTIENSGHEHLVPEKDTNVTINNVNINDDLALTSSTGKTYLSNTDGIDYSGSNFRIQGCNIADGDDDIVAKPASTACNNIVIYNCNIYNGHGISVGGGTAAGVSNMIVANCTFNPSNMSDTNQNGKNSITYGLRMKAEDGNDPNQTQSGDVGGVLQNVKYINISMTGVKNPIAIESYYDGGDTFADSPNDTAFYTYGGTPSTPLPPTAFSGTTPQWDNISYENVTATGATSTVLINGLNASANPTATPYANAINGLAFSKVNITGSLQMDLWYGANVDVNGLTINGATKSLYDLTNQAPGTVGLVVGDFNRDGHVDAADLQAMMLALTNLTSYRQTYFPLEVSSQYDALFGDQMEVIGDLNNDFVFSSADLQVFLKLLSQSGGFGSTASVPEPASVVLLAVGLCLLTSIRMRQRVTVRSG